MSARCPSCTLLDIALLNQGKSVEVLYMASMGRYQLWLDGEPRPVYWADFTTDCTCEPATGQHSVTADTPVTSASGNRRSRWQRFVDTWLR